MRSSRVPVTVSALPSGPASLAVFHDAGHILGSAIVELICTDGAETRSLVFSGDLGYRDAPVMDSPARLAHADAVMMESTYGDRLHRPFVETMNELAGFSRRRARRRATS